MQYFFAWKQFRTTAEFVDYSGFAVWSSSEDNVLDLLDPPDLFFADHPGRQDGPGEEGFFLSEGLQRLRNVTLMFRNRKHIRDRRRRETTGISKPLISTQDSYENLKLN